jgi:MerR HTH family regulatory protein
MAISHEDVRTRTDARAEIAPSRPRKALTIGAVCKILSQEFPDISISKIRYLEDQKLLSPRRTPGGYRLYSQADVERLRTILRLQRDEFLPLRVIRQELASGQDIAISGDHGPSPGAVRRAVTVGENTARFGLEQLVEEAGVSESLVSELEEFGIIQPEKGADNQILYDETDREIVRAAGELARFGVAGRNLRVFRSSADREAALLEQILGPALRSRNPARRKEAIENLENLAAICTHLKHLLLVRDLRRLTV